MKWFFKNLNIKFKKDKMTSKFFGNKHTDKKNKKTKINKNTNSKGKGSNMGIRKVGRGN